jgi:hypothetical protein
MTKFLATIIASLFAVSAFAAYAPQSQGQVTEIKQSAAAEQSGQSGEMQLAAKKKAPKKKHHKSA